MAIGLCSRTAVFECKGVCAVIVFNKVDLTSGRIEIISKFLIFDEDEKLDWNTDFWRNKKGKNLE